MTHFDPPSFPPPGGKRATARPSAESEGSPGLSDSSSVSRSASSSRSYPPRESGARRLSQRGFAPDLQQEERDLSEHSDYAVFLPIYPPRQQRPQGPSASVSPSHTRNANLADSPHTPERRSLLRGPEPQGAGRLTEHPQQPRPQQPPSFLPQGRLEELNARPRGRPSSPASSGADAHRIARSSETAHFRPVAPSSEGFQPPRRGFGATAREPRPRRRRFRFSFPILLLLAALIAWPLFLIIDANNNLRRIDALSGNADTPGTTYLLAGSDSREDGAVLDGAEGKRSDSIMLVHVAENGQASMVSIPRDTWVEIPGYGSNKINAAYSFEGPSLLVATVEQLAGLTIDHYLEIGMGGVGNIVDALGGVELCLDMDVHDDYSGLVWTSGCHVSDGPTALAFARMRYSDPLGDIGRAERQRQVVSKTVKSALSPATLINPLSAFRLERAGASALTVDPDTSSVDIARLASAFRQANTEDRTGTPPIASLAYETEAGVAVLLVDDTAPSFFESLRNGTLTPADFKQEFL
ncbi:transcriptional regulator [Schaalia canis]|uniref:Transcriptional regulator n=1 Tax=Schaalia canis TaxID=100469 RepID=A0A3P1SEB5_9ACTO|nr:transcriptional regulator [Schaalia canis]